jgi:hypothetical protein
MVKRITPIPEAFLCAETEKSWHSDFGGSKANQPERSRTSGGCDISGAAGELLPQILDGTPGIPFSAAQFGAFASHSCPKPPALDGVLLHNVLISWNIGPDSKSGESASVQGGSNPSLSARFRDAKPAAP